jgi:hypothetical protein
MNIAASLRGLGATLRLLVGQCGNNKTYCTEHNCEHRRVDRHCPSSHPLVLLVEPDRPQILIEIMAGTDPRHNKFIIAPPHLHPEGSAFIVGSTRRSPFGSAESLFWHRILRLEPTSCLNASPKPCAPEASRPNRGFSQPDEIPYKPSDSLCFGSREGPHP